MIRKDDPVTTAKYAIENNLTELTCWKWAKKYHKKMRRLVKQVKRMLNVKRAARAIKYQFGVRLPRTIREAYKLDEFNGNTKWADAIKTEVTLLSEDFNCFKVANEGDITNEYQRVPVIWAFAVKFDGRYRARACAGGHVTKDPHDNYYSGVVELETIRIALAVAPMMDLKVVAEVTDAHVAVLDVI